MKLDDKQFVSLTQMAMSMDHIVGLPLPTIPAMASATKIIDVLRFGPAKQGRDAVLNRLAQLIKQIQDAAAKYSPAATQQQDDVTNGNAAIWGIGCVDSANPRDERAWITTGQEQDAKAPGFGPRWTWLAPECANWPGSAADAYRGPFKIAASTPPLIVTPSHDPNTNVTGARAANELLTGSRIVEVQAWGHTALGRSTGCLTPATDTYLLTQRLPAKDLLCQADSQPWR